MVITIEADYTQEAVSCLIELSKIYKVDKLKMTPRKNGCQDLIMHLNQYDKIIVKGGLTSGYIGEGPSGTIAVLNAFGFNDIDDLVYESKEFELKFE